MFTGLLDLDNNKSHLKELERMRQKHQRELEKMKLRNELNIEKDTLKGELTVNKLKSEESQINVKREIFKLKSLVRKDDLTRRAGKLLKFWAILVTIISTILTMAGGYESFSKSIYTLLAFMGAVIVLQFTVFIIASQETRIKQEFFSHSWKCSLLKYSLLIVSIYNNYKFFEVENNSFTQKVITAMLCIGLDLIAIFLVGLAYDQITLNVFKKTEDKSLIYKLFYNLTFKFVDKINRRYEENLTKNDNIVEVKALTNDVIDDKIDKHTNLDISKNTKENLLPLTVSNEELKSYRDFILTNKDSNGYIPSYKEIAKSIKLSRTKAYEIKKYLDNIGDTKVDGKRTKLLIA